LDKNDDFAPITNTINNLLMKNILILTAVLLLVSCDQLIPIQKNGYGFTVGDPSGKLHIEAFFDFQCTSPLIQALIPRILIPSYAPSCSK
jgi:hypothetical protein